MTRYARFKGRQEHEASSWQDLNVKKNDFKTGRRKKGRVNPDKLDKLRSARRERRRKGKPCFHCRQPGHFAANCPQKNEEISGEKICFKCGSNEHNIYNCTAKVDQDAMPFAVCFICKEKGHLSSKCPDNPRGLYPDGGGCRFCGSVEHYRRDCPERFANKNPDTERNRSYRMRQNYQESVEAIDNSSEDDSDGDEVPKPKKSKLVKF